MKKTICTHPFEVKKIKEDVDLFQTTTYKCKSKTFAVNRLFCIYARYEIGPMMRMWTITMTLTAEGQVYKSSVWETDGLISKKTEVEPPIDAWYAEKIEKFLQLAEDFLQARERRWFGDPSDVFSWDKILDRRIDNNDNELHD